MPMPSTAMAIANVRSARVGSTVASRPTIATTIVSRPARTMERTGNRLESREPIAEAMNIVMDTGSILMPVSSGSSSPSTSCR